MFSFSMVADFISTLRCMFGERLFRSGATLADTRSNWSGAIAFEGLTAVLRLATLALLPFADYLSLEVFLSRSLDLLQLRMALVRSSSTNDVF